jgi:hypothetical protein
LTEYAPMIGSPYEPERADHYDHHYPKQGACALLGSKNFVTRKALERGFFRESGSVQESDSIPGHDHGGHVGVIRNLFLEAENGNKVEWRGAMLPDHYGISSGMPDSGPAGHDKKVQLPTAHEALGMDSAELARRQAEVAQAQGFEVVQVNTGPRVHSEYGTNGDPALLRTL